MNKKTLFIVSMLMSVGMLAGCGKGSGNNTPVYPPYPPSNVPTTSGGIPTSSSGIPGTSSGIPGTSSGIPGTSTSSGIPGTSSTEPVNVYIVKFNTQISTLNIPSQKIEDGGLVKRPDDPEKQDYIFKEWLYEGKAWDFNTPVHSNMTLTASYMNMNDYMHQNFKKEFTGRVSLRYTSDFDLTSSDSRYEALNNSDIVNFTANLIINSNEIYAHVLDINFSCEYIVYQKDGRYYYDATYLNSKPVALKNHGEALSKVNEIFEIITSNNTGSFDVNSLAYKDKSYFYDKYSLGCADITPNDYNKIQQHLDPKNKVMSVQALLPLVAYKGDAMPIAFHGVGGRPACVANLSLNQDGYITTLKSMIDSELELPITTPAPRLRYVKNEKIDCKYDSNFQYIDFVSHNNLNSEINVQIDRTYGTTKVAYGDRPNAYDCRNELIDGTNTVLAGSYLMVVPAPYEGNSVDFIKFNQQVIDNPDANKPYFFEVAPGNNYLVVKYFGNNRPSKTATIYINSDNNVDFEAIHGNPQDQSSFSSMTSGDKIPVGHAVMIRVNLLNGQRVSVTCDGKPLASNQNDYIVMIKESRDYIIEIKQTSEPVYTWPIGFEDAMRNKINHILPCWETDQRTALYEDPDANAIQLICSNANENDAIKAVQAFEKDSNYYDASDLYVIETGPNVNLDLVFEGIFNNSSTYLVDVLRVNVFFGDANNDNTMELIVLAELSQCQKNVTSGDVINRIDNRVPGASLVTIPLISIECSYFEEDLTTTNNYMIKYTGVAKDAYDIQINEFINNGWNGGELTTDKPNMRQYYFTDGNIDIIFLNVDCGVTTLMMLARPHVQ